ncbi:MAG: hypothetical protein KDL10_02460, partial [Kiritimatiellae bacterium]|nr:hypothetical protein [Kiritimatiellia bacterium]
MRSYIRFGVMLALSFSAGIRVIADGELDGVIGAQYGATIALDALDDGRCGENSIAEACDRGDLVELNALSWPDVAEGFQWYFEFTVDSSQSLSDAGEALEVFGSTCSERVTYFIGLDADCDGAPFLDMLDMPAPWSRNFSWQVDYFIVVHPAGPFDMAAELWAYTDEGIPPVFLVEVPVVTTVRGYRRTVELVLPIDSNVPNAIRKNKPIRVMVLAAEEVEGHDGGVYDWIGGAEPGECWESAEFSSDLYYCTAPTAKVSGAPTDPGINTLQSLSLPARDEAAMISSGLDCEAGGSQITVDGYEDDDLYTHLVEALFAAPYQGGSLEDSDAIGEPSAARFVDEEGLTDLEALGIQADIQQVLVSTDPDYLHIIVQGPTALGWTGVDVANLYIAIDVPVRESGTDSGSDCDAQANAPAGRAVNFQGWDPDWVVEITDPAQAFLWESDQDKGWDEVGHAINMETELIDAPLGFYYAADSEGYEVAIPWVKLGYTEPEFDPQTIRLAVYTTGDEQIGGRSDWDVYDQAPGVGQGGTGLGAPETLADGP